MQFNKLKHVIKKDFTVVQLIFFLLMQIKALVKTSGLILPLIKYGTIFNLIFSTLF